MNSPEVQEPNRLSTWEQTKFVAKGVAQGYKYDGCTAVPDFDFGADCCNMHDNLYRTHFVSRAAADRALRRCIQRKGYIVLPWVYWLGVRIFGRVFWNKHKKE
jgi:hypothetical protein